jgi:hypothetical protein
MPNKPLPSREEAKRNAGGSSGKVDRGYMLFEMPEEVIYEI